jgi:hypothetical protein
VTQTAESGLYRYLSRSFVDLVDLDLGSAELRTLWFIGSSTTEDLERTRWLPPSDGQNFWPVCTRNPCVSCQSRSPSWPPASSICEVEPLACKTEIHIDVPVSSDDYRRIADAIGLELSYYCELLKHPEALSTRFGRCGLSDPRAADEVPVAQTLFLWPAIQPVDMKAPPSLRLCGIECKVRELIASCLPDTCPLEQDSLYVLGRSDTAEMLEVRSCHALRGFAISLDCHPFDVCLSGNPLYSRYQASRMKGCATFHDVVSLLTLPFHCSIRGSGLCSGGICKGINIARSTRLVQSSSNHFEVTSSSDLQLSACHSRIQHEARRSYRWNLRRCAGERQPGRHSARPCFEREHRVQNS